MFDAGRRPMGRLFYWAVDSRDHSFQASAFSFRRRCTRLPTTTIVAEFHFLADGVRGKGT